MKILYQKKSNQKNSQYKILFLHGGPGMDCSYFLPYLEPLTEHYELQFYTQGTQNKQSDTRMDDLVNELSDIVESLQSERLIIFAHSFGAALFLEYLKNRGACPQHIRGLILCSWVYDTKWEEKFKIVYEKYKSKHKVNEVLKTNEDYRNFMLSMSPFYFSESHFDQGQKIVSNISYNTNLYNSISQTYCNNFDLSHIVKALAIPTLSISGAKDLVVNNDYIFSAAKLNKKMKFEELKDAGHFPFIENPNVIINIVREFIDSI